MKKNPTAAYYSDVQIVDILKRGDREEEQVLSFVYTEYYSLLERYIAQLGGDHLEIPDIFQDTLIVFYENIKSGKFVLKRTSILAYLYAVAKNMWLNKQKKRQLLQTYSKIELDKATISTPTESLEKEKLALIEEVINELNAGCQKVLLWSIYKQIPMKEIALRMGYKNEQIAYNKKSRCLKCLKKTIHNSPKYRRIFAELKE